MSQVVLLLVSKEVTVKEKLFIGLSKHINKANNERVCVTLYLMAGRPVIKVGVTPFWPSGFVFHVFSVRCWLNCPLS